MSEGLIVAQIVMLLLVAPMLLLLASLMIFHEPVGKPGLWRGLTALVVVLAVVSLLDAYRLDQRYSASELGFAVRTLKFITVGVCLWFAASERNTLGREARLDETARVQADTGLVLAKRGENLSNAGITLDEERIDLARERRTIASDRKDIDDEHRANGRGA